MKRLKETIKQDVLIRLGLALIIGLTLVQVPLSTWEGKLYNIRFALRGKRAPLNSIVLLGYDDSSVKTLGHNFPLTPKEHAELLRIVNQGQAAGVGLLYDLTTLYSLDALETLAHEVGHSAVPVLSSDWKGYIVRNFSGPLGEVFGPIIPAGLTEDVFSFAKDKVARRLVTQFNDVPQFELQMARLLRPQLHPRGVYDNLNFPEMKLQEMYVNYDGPAGTYPIIPIADVLKGRVELNDLKGKIVLVGRADFSDTNESRFNPFQTEQLSLTKLEADAQAIASLVRDNGLLKPASWVNSLATVSATILASFITMGSSPATGVMFLLIAIFSVFMISQMLFSLFGVNLGTIHPIIGIMITYYIYVPYRLIVEYRARFYYQKKHNLLKQVEELKTNFISLMSHDIKTPIAKIHGLAESGLRQSDQSGHFFSSIISCADDLTRFVNSILDLSKLESGAMKLQLTSKDLNSLVKDCVKHVEYFAKQRGIRIETHLEPMFSVSMDPNLIRQVIQNLLDNSLKYSKSNSIVSITTKDLGDSVEFTITDQGEGIAGEDIEHIFERFYRPQRTIEKRHSGTGLGLYLVKYFVELHRGHVSVESTPGSGSTFKVQLPTAVG